MAEPTEAPETAAAIETTPPKEWIIPNQHLFEQLIDQRLEQHKSAEKPASTRSRAASTSDKETKAETPTKS